MKERSVVTKHDVVITGMGMATPIGHDAASVWTRLIDATTAVRPLEPFGRGGATVDDFEPSEHVTARRILRMTNRATIFALAAARRAWKDAGFEGQSAYDPTRFGIYVGSGESEMRPESFFPGLEHAIDENGQLDVGAFARTGLDNIDPYLALTSLSNNALCYVSVAHQLMGPNNNYVKSAVASSQALGEAAWAVRHGYADAVMVVGVDSLSDPFAMAGYDSAGLLCQEKSYVGAAMRPFDRTRSGFVPGEGAGALIVETEENARRRGAKINGRVLGFGQSTDAFGTLDGGELPAAIAAALEDAELGTDRIDFVVAHGSGTVTGDAAEAAALTRAALHHKPITAIKPVSGHLGAASGAVEGIFTLLMMQHQQLPPICNLRDAAMDLAFVTERPRREAGSVGLHIARGIGGQNAVLLLGAA